MPGPAIAKFIVSQRRLNIFGRRCKSFHFDKLLKQILGQEFVTYRTCHTVFEILIKTKLNARLKFLQLTVWKSSEIQQISCNGNAAPLLETTFHLFFHVLQQVDFQNKAAWRNSVVLCRTQTFTSSCSITDLRYVVQAVICTHRKFSGYWKRLWMVNEAEGKPTRRGIWTGCVAFLDVVDNRRHS